MGQRINYKNCVKIKKNGTERLYKYILKTWNTVKQAFQVKLNL